MGEVETVATMTEARTAEWTFKEKVLPERPRLYALAMTILRDPAEAEDAVQETMLIAWRKLDQLSDPGHPEPWLTRICVNECLRRRRLLGRFGFARQTSDDQAAPLQIELEGRLLDFDRAFRKLSLKQRTAFILHVQHGFTVDESARLMSCRAGTVRSHLGRAISKLREEMRDG